MTGGSPHGPDRFARADDVGVPWLPAAPVDVTEYLTALIAGGLGSPRCGSRCPPSGPPTETEVIRLAVAGLSRQNRRPAVQVPALLDDVVEAILATARLPRRGAARAHGDPGAGCPAGRGGRRPGAGAGAAGLRSVPLGSRRPVAGIESWAGGCELVTHVDGFLLFWHCCGLSKVVSGSDGDSWRFAGVVTLCIREPPGWCRRFSATLVLAQERIVACLLGWLAPLVHSYEHAYGCDYHAEGHGPSAVE